MSDRAGAAPERLDRSKFSLAFADYFTGDRLDTSTEHVYSAEWNSRHGRFYIDERHVPTVEQCLTYPLQLMVHLFEFPTNDRCEGVDYPKSAEVRGVRGYEWV